ncbi:MAG: glycoside hydrolase family 16 protein [Lentisphaeria bacterium]|nr:glycoside hydrolase family 16 protein [Lentisphaeria bacterium]
MKLLSGLCAFGLSFAALATDIVGIHNVSEYSKRVNKHCGWESHSDSQSYAWTPPGRDKPSALVEVDMDDKIEGKMSYRFTMNASWSRWVLNMNKGRTVDYSKFDRLVFYVKSEEAQLWDDFYVVVQSPDASYKRKLSEIGFIPDGRWHACVLPIADIKAGGVNTEYITSLIQIGWGGGVNGGHTFNLDNVHLQKGPLLVISLPDQKPTNKLAIKRLGKNPFHDMSGYELVWADEFNGSGPPNEKYWNFEEGFARNREIQWYQKDNAYQKDGLLVFEGRKEKKPNPTYKAGSKDWRTNREFIEYTSASITTKGKVDWKYGRFEIRAKVDTRSGMWPAIWTIGVEGEWPSNGEIDIMEYYTGKIMANAAWGTKVRWRANWDSHATRLEQLGGEKWADEFHIWRMDWTEDYIRLYVDDILLNETLLKDTINPTDLGPKNPFQQAHFFLLNLAIGGDLGGDPEQAEWPGYYLVDYVRVYQKKK